MRAHPMINIATFESRRVADGSSRNEFILATGAYLASDLCMNDSCEFISHGGFKSQEREGARGEAKGAPSAKRPAGYEQVRELRSWCGVCVPYLILPRVEQARVCLKLACPCACASHVGPATLLIS